MHGVACTSPAHAACGQTDLQSSLPKLATDVSVVPALSPNLYMCPSWWSDLAVLIAVLRVVCLKSVMPLSLTQQSYTSLTNCC